MEFPRLAELTPHGRCYSVHFPVLFCTSFPQYDGLSQVNAGYRFAMVEMTDFPTFSLSNLQLVGKIRSKVRQKDTVRRVVVDRSTAKYFTLKAKLFHNLNFLA